MNNYMYKWRSPLRYPGGKIKLAPFFKQLIISNPNIKHYIEPFAGGAGTAINLLLNGIVDHITLNDYDIAVYSFWNSLINYGLEFIERFDKTPINIDEWNKQITLFKELEQKEAVEFTADETIKLGFATFYLNRTNFSGILRGATPVGGMKQLGKWKMDYEFNKERLRPLLLEIIKYSNHISVTNFDITSSLIQLEKANTNFKADETLLFIDPPYVDQGKRLYLPIKTMDKHKQIANQVEKLNAHWVLTYDAVDELIDYYNFSSNRFLYTLRYHIKKHRNATEFLAISDKLLFNFEDIPNVINQI